MAYQLRIPVTGFPIPFVPWKWLSRGDDNVLGPLRDRARIMFISGDPQGFTGARKMKREISGLFWGVLCIGLLVTLFALLAVLAVREGRISPPMEQQIHHEKPARRHRQINRSDIT